ncbi:MAG: chromosome partitioning protein ParB, partial [Pseudomonadota bacterium]
MSTKKPKLGRGLDALLGSAIESAASAKDELKHIPVDLLQRGKYQP